MTTQREVMQMALDALLCANSPNGDYANEIAALRAALAEPVPQIIQQLGYCPECGAEEIEAAMDETPEPVAWMSATGESFIAHADVGNIPNWSDYYLTPLYSHPPAARLTDEEIDEIYDEIWPYAAREWRDTQRDFARRIERRIREGK